MDIRHAQRQNRRSPGLDWPGPGHPLSEFEHEIAPDQAADDVNLGRTR
ncbi:MAG: hypothetical protein V3T64_05395 [Myxococcota bacterium]